MMFSELTSSPVGRSARHSALLLHAMAPSDRSWLLSRLPLPQQQELTALVAELDGLGISPDASVLNEALNACAPGTEAHTTMREEATAFHVAEHSSPLPAISDFDFLMALDEKDLVALSKAWRSEPPGLVAMALRLQAWPWQRTLLERLPALPRRRVEDMLDMENCPVRSDSALALALMASMRTCCESARIAVQDSLPEKALGSGQGWKSRMSRWTGALARTVR
ncbi:hypothetical protein AVMA1855_24220 [Acidovorax sp. SUPP1855]|nr:hypothetical protein AVMA1855_24220 [Acidovorax sp. SUPP1855]